MSKKFDPRAQLYHWR